MTESLSYQAIRNASLARESEELRTSNRNKNLLILVLHYLSEHGYVESAKTLEQETNLRLSSFEVCDNVNLETVLMEYESYYHVKFNRYPKITKKQNTSTEEVRVKPTRSKLSAKNGYGRNLPKLESLEEGSNSSANRVEAGPGSGTANRRALPGSNLTNGSSRPESGARKAKSAYKKFNSTEDNLNSTNSNGLPDPNSLNGFLVCSGTIGSSNNNNNNNGTANDRNTGKAVGRPIIDIRAMINSATRLPVDDSNSEDRLLKPLGGFSGYSMEWRELAQVISRDIYLENPNVRWDDIVGLDNAKSLVKEAVVYPIKYPQLFTGILTPWKGLLLYGPPGTGKTLLAKAVATECRTTFFNISASSIVSKWRGDSEKLVRVLFELARFHAPSTIFLDELESLMSQRGGQSAGGEHEGSRRMKTELLVQMDGLSKSDDLVFLLAASNLPWELDHAMLRRLEKRILVGLPTVEARAAMFHNLLPPDVCTTASHGIELTAELDYEKLAEETDGYSGSDIRLVCKEAAMRPVRKVFQVLENHDEGVELHISLDPISTEDVQAALSSTKPSAKNLTGQYTKWQKDYESV